MSGIVALVERPGKEIDRALLDSLVESLGPRGPDRRSTWVDGSTGLGHALLETGVRPAGAQPVSLDGESWIVADARVDARDELIARLPIDAGRGRELSDAELLLHAYRVWGERCVEHLLGDFAFAIWDGRAKRLFAARDRFGVRPLYYASLGDGLILASAIDTVRLHPEVPDELDELSIADFLLFGFNQDLDRTSFAAVRALPAAHQLACGGRERLRVRRYWRLSVPEDAAHEKPHDIVERFHDLVRTAVVDRAGSAPIGAELSGGIDAASVLAAGAAAGGADRARACTLGFRRIFADPEERFARLTADSLGVRLDVVVADRTDPFASFRGIIAAAPEPDGELFTGAYREELGILSEHSRVALTGWDGDALLAASFPAHFRTLLRTGRLGRFAGDAVRLARRAWTPPSRSGLRTWLMSRTRKPADPREFPPFLSPSLERRLDLVRRFEHYQPRPLSGDGARATALDLLTGPIWQVLFVGYDPMRTGQPLEAAHPLLDLRLVEYALSLPAVPWCVDKTVLRESARNSLPASVVERPKTALQGDLLLDAQRLFRPDWSQLMRSIGSLERFVDLGKVPLPSGAERHELPWEGFRVLALGWWLGGHGLEG